MKLHENKRMRTKVQRCLSLLIVASMIFSGSSSYIASAEGTGTAQEAHVHDESCYEKRLVCGMEEHEDSAERRKVLVCDSGKEGHVHTDECYVEEGTLVCGLEEQEGHVHTDECYARERVLVCGMEEQEGHAHTDDCYAEDGTLLCGMEEDEGHQHTADCYAYGNEGHKHTDKCYEYSLICGMEENVPQEETIDTSADVEDEAIWDAMFADVEWQDSWGGDLVTAAQMQIGYRESERNYAVTENGSHKGYTRYGQFAGDVYADWDVAFVNFCMYYAGLTEYGTFPDELDAAEWYEAFAAADERNIDYLTEAEGYVPAAGDIVFLERAVEIDEAPEVSEAPAETEAPAESESPAETEEPTASGKPVETEEPTESGKPVETEEPTESGNPMETEEPVESGKPTETGNPMETVEPVESGKPVETEEPVESGKPAVTGEPVESGKPEETGEPVETEGPAESGKPGETEEPVGTEEPAESEAPVNTSEPIEAEVPAETEAPVETEKPEGSEAPAETEVPVETAIPAPTEVPSESESSIETSAPIENKNIVELAENAEEADPISGEASGLEAEFFEETDTAAETEMQMKMGIVSSYNAEENTITVIEGDYSNEVMENTYDLDDSEIFAYLKLTELETAVKENLRELIWEDEFVEIIVTAKEENAIPAGAILKVVPILKGAEETKEKYQEVEAQLQQKVQQDAAEFNSSDEFDIEMEVEVVGFLAYDIAIVTAKGEEIEPESGVVVSMRYKAAMQPEEVENVEDELSMTVMHLEEDEAGEVKEVVNIAEQEQLKEMTTTEDQKVERIEFETDSFSTYAVTWTNTTLSTATTAAAPVKNTPVHHKYIKRNVAGDGSTNNYTVSLDVVGKVEKKTIDLLLIVDASNSMKDKNSKGVARYSQVQTAINNMISSAKTQKADTVTINVGVVEFSDGYNKEGDFDYGSPYYQWTTDGKTYLGGDAGTWYFPRSAKGDGSKIPDQAYQMKDTKPDAVQKQAFKDITKMGTYKISKFGCGTNWQAGIQEAEKMLAGRSNETYVIFLTDGLPTVRYKDGYRTQGACSDAYYQNNATFKGNDNPNYKAAVSQWNKSTKLKAAKTYVVYAGDTACKNRCNAFANSINAENDKTALNGTSATALKNSFNSILKNITGLEYTDVVIQDTLSSYVDYAYKSIAAKNFVVYENNTKLALDTDYTIAFSGTGKKTFKVTIKRNGGTLKNNATYRVQINVIPSETAIKYALQNNTVNYPHTGDKGTDGPGNVSTETSSGKKGFYSNDNANTILTYKASGVAGSSPYEKPVIQVETTTWAVEKKWAGDVADSVTVTLKATRKDTGAEIGYINTLLQEKKLQDVTLNATNTWQYTWNNLPKYYYYYDGSGNAQHTPVVYTVTEKEVLKNEGSTSRNVMNEYTQASNVSGNKTTITNTRKGILYVEKNWTDGEANHIEEEIKVGLYKKNGVPAAEGDIYGNMVLTLNAGNQWGRNKKTYFALGTNVTVTDYTIKELKAVTGNDFDFEVDGKYYKGVEKGNVTWIENNRYLAEYSYNTETDGGKVVITNTPLPGWQLIKCSSTDTALTLEGAEFTLAGDTTYKGVSGANGIVKWTDPNGAAVEEKDIKDGSYVLTETKAPNGYKLGDSWQITITNGTPSVVGQTGEVTQDGILRFYFDNELLGYVLPSTGGHGIYWYMVSGTLLLMAGGLILYKNKKRKVRRC